MHATAHVLPDEHPLASCSARVLRTLIGLALPADEALRLTSQACGATEWSGEAMRLLLDRVQTDEATARALDDALAAHLAERARTYEGWALADISRFWSVARSSLNSAGAAALLWIVARRTGAGRRTLEERIADDIELRALHALARGDLRRDSAADSEAASAAFERSSWALRMALPRARRSHSSTPARGA